MELRFQSMAQNIGFAHGRKINVKLAYHFLIWLLLGPWLATSFWIWIMGMADAPQGETVSAVLYFIICFFYGLIGIIYCLPATVVASMLNVAILRSTPSFRASRKRLWIFFNVIAGSLAGLLMTSSFSAALIGAITAFALATFSFRQIHVSTYLEIYSQAR